MFANRFYCFISGLRPEVRSYYGSRHTVFVVSLYGAYTQLAECIRASGQPVYVFDTVRQAGRPELSLCSCIVVVSTGNADKPG